MNDYGDINTPWGIYTLKQEPYCDYHTDYPEGVFIAYAIDAQGEDCSIFWPITRPEAVDFSESCAWDKDYKIVYPCGKSYRYTGD